VRKLLTLVLIAFSVYFYWYLFLPTTKDLNSCFNDSAASSEQLLGSAQSGSWTKKQVCENGEVLMSSLRNCLIDVKGKRFLYSPVMQISGVRVKAENLVSRHNQVCSQNQVKPFE